MCLNYMHYTFFTNINKQFQFLNKILVAIWNGVWQFWEIDKNCILTANNWN